MELYVICLSKKDIFKIKFLSTGSAENLLYKGFLDESIDWNSLIDSGIYRMCNTLFFSPSLNYPVNVYPYGLLFVFNNSDSSIQQIYIPHQRYETSNNSLAYRAKWDNTQNFSTWIYLSEYDYTSISLNRTGYIIFKNELKIQWIRVTVPANKSSYEFTFPIQANLTTIAQAAHWGSDKDYFLVSAVGKSSTIGIIYLTKTTVIADYTVLLLGY